MADKKGDGAPLSPQSVLMLGQGLGGSPRQVQGGKSKVVYKDIRQEVEELKKTSKELSMSNDVIKQTIQQHHKENMDAMTQRDAAVAARFDQLTDLLLGQNQAGPSGIGKPKKRKLEVEVDEDSDDQDMDSKEPNSPNKDVVTISFKIRIKRPQEAKNPNNESENEGDGQGDSCVHPRPRFPFAAPGTPSGGNNIFKGRGTGGKGRCLFSKKDG